MADRLVLRLDSIQPTQLYINASKLATLEAAYPPGTETSMEPVPVTQMHGKVVYTDGHTRAFLLWKRGIETIDAIWDDTELNALVYETCLCWCEDEQVFTIADLNGRVLDDETYQQAWIARCQAIEHE